MRQSLTPEERAEIQRRIAEINLRLAGRDMTTEELKTLPAERNALEKVLAGDGQRETSGG